MGLLLTYGQINRYAAIQSGPPKVDQAANPALYETVRFAAPTEWIPDYPAGGGALPAVSTHQSTWRQDFGVAWLRRCERLIVS